MLVAMIIARRGTYIIEQPRQSLLYRHPRFVWLSRVTRVMSSILEDHCVSYTHIIACSIVSRKPLRSTEVTEVAGGWACIPILIRMRIGARSGRSAGPTAGLSGLCTGANFDAAEFPASTRRPLVGTRMPRAGSGGQAPRSLKQQRCVSACQCPECSMNRLSDTGGCVCVCVRVQSAA